MRKVIFIIRAGLDY